MTCDPAGCHECYREAWNLLKDENLIADPEPNPLSEIAEKGDVAQE